MSVESVEIAGRIRECFADDFSTQAFKVNGELIEADGETTFYKKSDITNIMDKINILIRDLENE